MMVAAEIVVAVDLIVVVVMGVVMVVVGVVAVVVVYRSGSGSSKSNNKQ